MAIDIAFDFRTDTPEDLDPDAWSPTLRRCDQLLWTKRLASGQLFDLSANTPGAYLYHSSRLGEFRLSSNSVMATFTQWEELKPITSQFPESENEAFRTIAYTIGAMMIFPCNQVEHHWTINQARGCIKPISDRFDLTVECIRRHYLEQPSPLAETLARYAEFFDLFGDFRGYVTFFLLEDLIAQDGGVKFFMPFDDFLPLHVRDVPKDVDTYKDCRRRSIEFIEARNGRIEQLGL